VVALPPGRRAGRDHRSRLYKEPARRGFTLLELLVATAMAAVLAASLAISMRVAFKARESAETAIEPSRTAEVSLDFLRNDLQSALVPKAVTNTTTFFGPFEGAQGANGADVTFFTTADARQDASANGEVKQVELTAAVPVGGSQICLVRRVIRNLTSAVQAVPDEEVLCRNISTFSVRYFDGSQWQEQWDSTQQNNEIPAAIEVTLGFDRAVPSGGSRHYQCTRVFPVCCSTANVDSASFLGGLP
jgi:prepilin-type N-terminal cleavage/methylation domain-containing protein